MELFKCGPHKCPNGQITGDCVFYSGPNLSNGIKTGDDLNTFVQKLSNLIVVCTDINITYSSPSKSVTVGSSVTFNVVATGSNITYQWYKDGVLISGATSNKYSIQSTLLSDAATYKCVLTNSCSTATTPGIVLTVNSVVTEVEAKVLWTDNDPTLTIEAGNYDSLNPQVTIDVSSDSTEISFDVTSSDPLKWWAIEYPSSLGTFTKWYNTNLNYGDIPDLVFKDIITVGDNSYIISRSGTITMSADSGTLLTFSK